MNVGGTSLPCIYDLLSCLYIDVKENIICQNLRFFLLFMESLQYRKPNVSSIISYVSWAIVTAVTACIRANNVVKLLWTTISFPISFTHSVCSKYILHWLTNHYSVDSYFLCVQTLIGKKCCCFFFVFVFQSMFSMWTILGVKSHLHVTYKLYPQLLWLMSITQYQCLHNFIGICLFSCSAFSNVLFYYLCVESRFDVILWFWNIVFFFFWVMLEPYLSFSWII